MSKTHLFFAALITTALLTANEGLAQYQEGQVQTIVRESSGSQQIDVPVGSIFEIISFTNDNDMTTFFEGRSILSVTKNDQTTRFAFSNTSYWLSIQKDRAQLAEQNTTDVGRQATGSIAGPALINFESQGPAVLTYRLYSNSAASALDVPTSAVVIPADANGSVSIILESSVDMVTWTAALPGTYGSSTEKRFFRVRAVNQ